MTTTKCPIWGTTAIQLDKTGDGQTIQSVRSGGNYYISGSSEEILKHYDDKNRIKLTSWLVEARRLGNDCPKIIDATLQEIERSKPQSVLERADNLLRYLKHKSQFIGDVTRFYDEHMDNLTDTENELFAWTASLNLKEIITFSEYCAEHRWIKHKITERPANPTNLMHEIMLWPQGYERLANLSDPNSGTQQAFVAMWFDPSVKSVYEEGIKLGIEDAGYKSIRIDYKHHNNKIDDEIIAEIRRSRFLVADFTANFNIKKDATENNKGSKGARGGVYYEAGFAHGLGIPVIFCCRHDLVDFLHFDIRQYNCLIWTDTGGFENQPPYSFSGLRYAIANRIAATVGDLFIKRKI